MSEIWQGPLQKIDDCRFRIPKSYKSGMRVDGIIYADERLLEDIRHDKACEQVANVAFLPGIVNYSLAMPDIHWGYGFCIGGVAATDPDNGGVVSPSGVGYDINCGIRMVRTNLRFADIKDKIKDLTYALFSNIPSGVGSKGDIRVSAREEKEILVKGAEWAVERGYGLAEDLECTEENGAISSADPDAVSDRAY
ncbi:MAG: RtcB family protein, partial [Candidatus Omnitrophota bacterium]